MTKRELCLHLLETQEWVTTNEFLAAGCGSRFGARIQELRDRGYDIPPAERVRDGQARYTLRSRERSERRSAESGRPGNSERVDRCVSADGPSRFRATKSSSLGCPDDAPLVQALQDDGQAGGVLHASPVSHLSRGGSSFECPQDVHQGSAAAITGSYYAAEAEQDWEAAA